MPVCRLRNTEPQGKAHPDVVKHAKAREADDVHRRQQYVDGKHWLPAPFRQDAAVINSFTHRIRYNRLPSIVQ